MTNKQQNKADFSQFDRIIQGGLRTAIFDVEGTLVDSNITRLYLFMKRNRSNSDFSYYVWLAWLFLTFGLYYRLLDEFDRELLQKAFYKRYAGFDVKDVYTYGKMFFTDILVNNFIPYVHDLLLYLKHKRINVFLLSTAIDPIVRPLASHFDVPYHCLQLLSNSKGCIVDLSDLNDFKVRFVKRFPPGGLMVVSDSKHDLQALKYARYPVIVTDKKRKWMKQIKGKIVINNMIMDSN